jgi:CBS domain containing-hemolysin-like protein
VIATTTLVLILIVCMVAQAFFVGSEVALSTCNRSRLHAEKSRSAQLARSLAERPQIGLSTTLIGANLAGLVAVLITAVYLAQRDIHPLLAVAIVVPVFLVVGHVMPKTVGQAHADTFVKLAAPLLVLASWVLRPLVLVVSGFAAAMTRLLGSDQKNAFVTRDELALLIESEPETDKPQIAAEEREMIANVFELSTYTVRDLMVLLSEVTALPSETSLAQARVELADKQHSRMPVYRQRVDNVVGVVHVFDLLQTDPRSETVADVMRPATYVPETMKAVDLLVELQAEGQHLAIVVDEYGGAIGIVTVEDLLETIVGDIEDEYDDAPSPLRAEKPGVWRVKAKTSVVRVNQELDLGLPESDDYDTIAGLLIDRLRHIPDAGETLTIGGAVIEVIQASDRVVETVRITKRKK